jgi:hypothetical protein
VVGVRRVDRADSASPGTELAGFDYALVPQSEDSPSFEPEPTGPVALDSSTGGAAAHGRTARARRRAPSRRARLQLPR